jgi:hypothetical protein
MKKITFKCDISRCELGSVLQPKGAAEVYYNYDTGMYVGEVLMWRKKALNRYVVGIFDNEVDARDNAIKILLSH